MDVEYYSHFETNNFLNDLDVIVITVPVIQLEDDLATLPHDAFRGKLVVEMGVLNSYPKSVLLRIFGNYPDVDILTSHAMLGPIQNADGSPYAGTSSWDGRPFVYEKVRIAHDALRCERFLKIFEEARCRMVEMSAEQHDASIADAEFVTYLTGRLLVDKQLLPPTPVASKEYAALCDVADMTANDSFDLFFGMYKYNDRAKEHMSKMRDNLAHLERQLAAKEAYLAASAEMKNSDRQRLIAETRLLLQEVARESLFGQATPTGASLQQLQQPSGGEMSATPKSDNDPDSSSPSSSSGLSSRKRK
jgi:arogenate dehydrogenase (NADP+), plant